MKTCKHCLLVDLIPSVKIENDSCNYCQNEKINSYNNIRNIEENIIKLRGSTVGYDILLAYSGGKDSTFVLNYLVKELNLKVLTLTFNNGFLSATSKQNIVNVCDILGVENICIAPPREQLVNIFKKVEDNIESFPKKALERASAICTLCIGLVKNYLYIESIKRNIPYVSFGWSPGQIDMKEPFIKIKKETLEAFQSVIYNILLKIDKNFAMNFYTSEIKSDVVVFYPFYYKNKYNEAGILKQIRKLGWRDPIDTDGNSTNCLLNSYANYKHYLRFGYNPYNFEISTMIRKGILKKEDGAIKLNKIYNKSILSNIAEIFGENIIL